MNFGLTVSAQALGKLNGGRQKNAARANIAHPLNLFIFAILPLTYPIWKSLIRRVWQAVNVSLSDSLNARGAAE
jgi:hypothetical protein